MRNFAVVLVILCFSTPTLQTAVAQTTPPAATQPTTSTDASKATGQRIGTMVSAAVDTAFPVIGKIMDLFKTKKPDEKATQADVQKAVKAAQDEFKKTAKEQLQPVATVSKELGVIQAFAAAGVKARANIATITSLLAQSNPNYTKIALEWKIAKNNLADVLTLKPADIRAIREPTIQERCLDLQSSRNDLMVRIDASLTEATSKDPKDFSKQELQDQISAMSALLKGFDSLAAIELATLQDDIDGLSKWANGSAGLPKKEAPLKAPNPILLEFVTTAQTKIKRALEQH
jgi:hypothetical protein